jgi:hypothetical protein
MTKLHTYTLVPKVRQINVHTHIKIILHNLLLQIFYVISSLIYIQTVKDLQNLANSCGYDDTNPWHIVSWQTQTKTLDE